MSWWIPFRQNGQPTHNSIPSFAITLSASFRKRSLRELRRNEPVVKPCSNSVTASTSKRNCAMCIALRHSIPLPQTLNLEFVVFGNLRRFPPPSF